MSIIAILALIMSVILGTLIIWRVNEPAVRTTVSLIDKGRLIFGTVFLGLAVFHFLRSGDPLQITLAIIGIGFLTGWMLVERPLDETI